MDVDKATDLLRDTMYLTLIISAPMLMIGLVVGLLISLFQAVTQIQEQTLVFVPKIVAMVLALSLALPWLVSQIVQYSTDLIAGIPGRFF